MAPPSTAARSLAFTLYIMVPSIASPTNGTNTNSMRVNMTITLPAWRLHFRESGVSPGPASSGLEYRICITASLGVSHLPRAGKKHLHQIYRLAGLVTVRVRGIFQRIRQQVEGGHVRRVCHVIDDGDIVLFGRVQIRGGRRTETAGPQACIANRVALRKHKFSVVRTGRSVLRRGWVVVIRGAGHGADSVSHVGKSRKDDNSSSRRGHCAKLLSQFGENIVRCSTRTGCREIDSTAKHTCQISRHLRDLESPNHGGSNPQGAEQ